jgi:metal-responsive CopG/Arc/MetJ family transcriptional regulator
MTKNVITVKMEKNVEDLIDQYAGFMGLNRSEAIRDLITEALFMKTKHVQFKRLEEYIMRRDPFKFRTECEHCGIKDNLVIFYIDGNVENFKSENIITLCKKCLTEFELFRLKQNVKERFIEWFFKD